MERARYGRFVDLVLKSQGVSPVNGGKGILEPEIRAYVTATDDVSLPEVFVGQGEYAAGGDKRGGGWDSIRPE